MDGCAASDGVGDAPAISPAWKERCRSQDTDNRDVAVDTNSSVLCFTH